MRRRHLGRLQRALNSATCTPWWRSSSASPLTPCVLGRLGAYDYGVWLIGRALGMVSWQVPCVGLAAVATFTRPPLGSILADHLGRWTAFVPWFPRPLTQASPE